ncbi:MAG: hypothetical protein JWQ04_1136 [Pedosphaera sp.]|nr:hypothetical protein [Pedosphaera sp.]
MDSLHLAHLDWMFENQPHLVRQLDRAGKLLSHLNQQRDQANQVKIRALEAGRPEDEAHEMMLAILAPPDGPALMHDPPPEPVPYQEAEQIADRLEAQEASLKKRTT